MHFNACYSTKATNSTRVTHWAVGVEKHADGADHYHCSMTLSPNPKRWLKPWEAMFTLGVCVNFSDKQDYYISAFKYLLKEDENVYLSDEHPRLEMIASPRTKSCNATNRRRRQDEQAAAPKGKAKKGTNAPPPPKERPMRSQWNHKLHPLEVGQYIIEHKIDTLLQLYALAEERHAQGECDLAKWLFTRSDKSTLTCLINGGVRLLETRNFFDPPALY